MACSAPGDGDATGSNWRARTLFCPTAYPFTLLPYLWRLRMPLLPLLAGANPKFQVNGFPLDFFTDNYMDSSEVCGPSNLGGLSGNTFFKISDSPTPAVTGTQPVGTIVPNKCDKSPQKAMTTVEVEALAHKLVGLTK